MTPESLARLNSVNEANGHALARLLTLRKVMVVKGG